LNWKYEAIERLKDYDAKKRALISIPEELRRLKLQSTAIRSASSDGTAVHGGGSGREDAMLNNIVYRESLKNRLDQTRLWVSATDRALAALTDEERLVLDRLYLHPARGNVDRLCQDLNVEKSAVYDRRDRALRHFTVALFGTSES